MHDLTNEQLAEYIKVIGEDVIVQRRLEGRCILCGEPDGKHFFSCPEMSHRRYMFGEQFVTDSSNPFYEDTESDM